MNVLLTCAGRRNYLVEYFREALNGDGLVLAADASMQAAAMQVADRAILVPPVSHPDYVRTLLEVCQTNDVRLLVPLNDLELPVLAKQRQMFLDAGVLPVVSSPEVIDICFDKWKTVQFLEQHGLRSPVTYRSLEEVKQALEEGAIRFPLVLKPRWGSASIGIEFVGDEEEMELAYRLLQKRLPQTILGEASQAEPDPILIQEKLVGEEMGLDVVNNFQAETLSVTVKKKIAMRAGETDRAGVVHHPELAALGTQIGAALGHIGNLDCDVFMTENGPYVLELNPRFGGHYPFAHYAGANLPAALIAWAQDKPHKVEWLNPKAGVFSAKFSQIIGIPAPDGT